MRTQKMSIKGRPQHTSPDEILVLHKLYNFYSLGEILNNTVNAPNPSFGLSHTLKTKELYILGKKETKSNSAATQEKKVQQDFTSNMRKTNELNFFPKVHAAINKKTKIMLQISRFNFTSSELRRCTLMVLPLLEPHMMLEYDCCLSIDVPENKQITSIFGSLMKKGIFFFIDLCKLRP